MVDDHARIAFTAMHPDERQDSAVRFLKDAAAYYAQLGVRIKRLITDTTSAPRRPSARLCSRPISPTT